MTVRGSLVAALVAMPSLPLQAQAAGAACAGATLRLHPDNPRYFLFRGKPTVVITSGEHYGAVLNLDFDYRRYLDTLAARRPERHADLRRAPTSRPAATSASPRNTLDPAPGRFISPWARSTTPGYADGGDKFDLTRFDDAYFTRLRDVAAVGVERRGHHRRARALLPALRGLDVGGQPDERRPTT